MTYPYNPKSGIAYARSYALYFELPEERRLFFYDQNGSDCTNFCSQCVWAAYGGWLPGLEAKNTTTNKERIKKMIRMAPFVWYGSLFFSGSNKWCRVVEFHDYALAPKAFGPKAFSVYEGGWEGLKPSAIKAGDVIQLVVVSYAPNRFGHCLYVTQHGGTFEDTLICCHSYDRRDTPLSEFSNNPVQYPRIRVLRFGKATFSQ